MGYPTYWRLYFLGAMFLHLIVWLLGSLLLPYFIEKPVLVPPEELVWADDFLEEEEMPAVDPPKVEPIKPPLPEEIKEEIEEDTSPTVAETEEEAIANLKEIEKEPPKAEKDTKKDKKDAGVVIIKKSSGVQMGQPPKLIEDFYPSSVGVNFKGRVSVFATIGKDGNVKETKIAITSGRLLIDHIAMNAVKRWKFKPALDHLGKPMECLKVIPIVFNMPRYRDS